MLSIYKVLIAVIGSALVIFLERALPFLLFSKKNPPKIITFIEKYIPPMVMASLLFYCLKDINFVNKTEEISKIDWKGFLPYLAGIASSIGLHLWKRNSLLSIFAGTVIYMILIRVL
ncbi:MAG: AzlD domain-containing protein [Treponema sp.]|nr:AzlD domain-containing protein [Treponema sp.]